LKHHLDGGIRGALTQEQADAKLAVWLEAGVDAKKEGLTKHKLMLKLKLQSRTRSKRLLLLHKLKLMLSLLQLLLLKKKLLKSSCC
jgi:hypothetical protein